MPKHWGLQYQARMESFTKIFTIARMYQEGLAYDSRRAERVLAESMEKEREGARILLDRERALKHLMDIGPHGLAKIEGEQGPEMDIEKFLDAMDECATKAVA